MKTRDQVSADKLRGGFYSPEPLVNLCLRRAGELLGDRAGLRVLEPSSGDGAFLRGAGASELANKIDFIEAIEIDPVEAAKSEAALEASSLRGAVHAANVLEWNLTQTNTYDLVLGNPPYVRFQFVSEVDRRRAVNIGSELGIPGSAVSNLWIPVLLLSLNRLKEGGVFSLILPTEFLTGVSAARVRRWLIRNTDDLRIDLFAPRSFPDVLQEVAVLTGRIARSRTRRELLLKVTDHNGGVRDWCHYVTEEAKTWTGYLLPTIHYSAVRNALEHPAVSSLGEIAKFSVSTVTGANKFFTVNNEVVEQYELDEWTQPFLPRTRYAPGLVFRVDEHEELVEKGVSSWLLDFAPGKDSPLSTDKARAYIEAGESDRLHTRYKTRIRTPWYRVPVVPPGELLMAKRSNRYPRMIVNEAQVLTTDTVYRGMILPESSLSARDFAVLFHNSLTLLTAEIEGRSFGGGVLELVPSEIASLSIPVVPRAAEVFSELDAIAREAEEPEALVEATDENLRVWLPEIDKQQIELIREAREILLSRRLERS